MKSGLDLSNYPYVDKIDPWSSHSIIVKWLSSFPPNTKVLDIGSANGIIGRLAKGLSLRFYGVESNPAWVETSQPFYQEVFCGNLDATPDLFLKDYQVVICADVLEHMPSPEKALNRLVSLQDMNVYFIISVPNVANIWIRLNLFLGRFDYADRGILDRTHLRFFTCKSLLKMVECCHLVIIKKVVTPIPLQLINPFFSIRRIGVVIYFLLAEITRLLPSLFGYQWVILTKKELNNSE